jgi:carbonic anhydrase
MRFVPQPRVAALSVLSLMLAAPVAFASESHAAPLPKAVSIKTIETPEATLKDSEATLPATRKAVGKVDAKVDAKAEPRTEAKADKTATAKPEPLEDPMDRLRRRLAEKLSNVEVPPNPHVLKVITRASVAEPSPGTVQLAAPRAAKPRQVAMTTPGATRKPADTAGATNHPNWSYEGDAGPERWAQLSPEFAACAKGSRQSPIDIRDGIAVQLDPVQFDYRASSFKVIDNGHTVQVNVQPGNFIDVTGRRYELQQFHFHRPSEERINGRQFDMVVHLVHKDAEGRLAVIAVLLDRGSVQPVVQSVWNNLPLEKGEEVPARVQIDLNALLPTERSYYTYMGSLTTPPCSEGVLWMVMQQPVGIAPEQIGVFSRMYPMNARPVQASAGRMIKGPR